MASYFWIWLLPCLQADWGQARHTRFRMNKFSRILVVVLATCLISNGIEHRASNIEYRKARIVTRYSICDTQYSMPYDFGTQALASIPGFTGTPSVDPVIPGHIQHD